MSLSFLPNISFLVLIIYILDFLLAFSIIFLERKNPSATVAWIMIIFIIPFFGIFLYLMFSQNISRQKIYKLEKYEESILDEALLNQIDEMKNSKFHYNSTTAVNWERMIQLNQNFGKAYYSQDNSINIFTDGKSKMNSLLRDIDEAKYSIHIMYFIVKNDHIGQELIAALTKKAKEGITVRFLLDGVGSRQISEASLREFKKAGGKYAFFFKPKFKYISLKLNYRNHRKLVVIDNRIGYLGGFNIGQEYLGYVKRFGFWRDTHIKVIGSSVLDMNTRFLMDWRVSSKEKVSIPSIFFDATTYKGKTGIQIVSSGPDSRQEEIKHGYLKMISTAKKNIFIQTPYFVPDASILESLKNAVLSGVDLRIMIPCMPDHMFVYWATYSYIGVLLEVGAKVYIYNNGFMHAKTICVDGEVASVGSANFDIRSFKLNFEANAFIYDSEQVFILENIYKKDMEDSTELTKVLYEKRSIKIKFLESISRLLSDLL